MDLKEMFRGKPNLEGMLRGRKWSRVGKKNNENEKKS
jgi:hypothetical protein